MLFFLYHVGKQVGILVDCGKIAMQTNFWLLGTLFSFLLPLSDQSPIHFHCLTSSMVERRLKLGSLIYSTIFLLHYPSVPGMHLTGASQAPSLDLTSSFWLQIDHQLAR